MADLRRAAVIAAANLKSGEELKPGPRNVITEVELSQRRIA